MGGAWYRQHCPYNASKFALLGYDGALRQELRPSGIHLALVEPGTTRTAIWGTVRASVVQSLSEAAAIHAPMLERYRASVLALQRGSRRPEYVADRIRARSRRASQRTGCASAMPG